MTTQTTPTVFSFEAASHIRAVSINGNPWFSAKDVCDALRLTNSRMALKALDDDEKADVSNTPAQMESGRTEKQTSSPNLASTR